MAESSLKKLVIEIEEVFETPVSMLLNVAEDMKAKMLEGLEEEDKDLEMIVTHVDELPTRKEGTFYALDFGGTNYRVARYTLTIEKKIDYQDYIYEHKIPDEIMKSDKAYKLYDYIASGLKKVVEGENSSNSANSPKELGFTFSYPMRHSSIKSGTLIKCTKDLNISDAVNRDAAAELKRAIDEMELPFHVAALVNDTTATLVAAKYNNKDVVAALVLGTGSNAAYFEKVENIGKISSEGLSSKDMVINMEWGNFNSSLLPRTKYDEELNEGKCPQRFEKLTSGMYLAEIIRKVLLQNAGDFNLSGIVQKLEDKNTLNGKNVSEIIQDKDADLVNVGDILKKALGIDDTEFGTRDAIADVCRFVTERGARLTAAGIVGILKKLKPKKGQTPVIGIDGSLYTDNQYFKECLDKALKEMLKQPNLDLDLDPESDILEPVEYGSRFGAAILASIYSSTPHEQS